MIITIIKVIFLLGVLIIIHELAHFFAARLSGVKVEEFAVGFGKKLYTKERNGTIYTLRLVPLGGYVQLKGLDEESNDKDSYTSVSILKRIFIIAAGGIVNILFGLIIYFVLVASLTDISNAFNATYHFSFSLVENLKILFTGGVGPDQLMGPIGISELVSETTKISEFIYLLAIVSLSLGITNLLPFPPLDGSKIILLIIEGIRKKPFKQEFELKLQFYGFVALILLSIYVAYNDVLRIF